MSNKDILDIIDERIFILDGAMGSTLIAHGLKPGIPPESWNVSNPDLIEKIHLEYFNAGADAVLTNTFGGSRMKLDAHGYGKFVEEYNTKAVEIARKVCPKDGYLAGDIGPSGKFLPPVGKASVDNFMENFEEQSQILAKAGVDFFFVETMVDIKEAEAAVKAAKKVSNIPIFASITYKKTKRGYFTIMGNTIDNCIKILEEAGADAIGANCTLGSDEMIDLIPQISKLTKLPVLAKPNAGKPELQGEETIYPATPEQFKKDIIAMINHQANIVGGCCGTSPKFIKKIADYVKGEG